MQSRETKPDTLVDLVLSLQAELERARDELKRKDDRVKDLNNMILQLKDATENAIAEANKKREEAKALAEGAHREELGALKNFTTVENNIYKWEKEEVDRIKQDRDRLAQQVGYYKLQNAELRWKLRHAGAKPGIPEEQLQEQDPKKRREAQEKRKDLNVKRMELGKQAEEHLKAQKTAVAKINDLSARLTKNGENFSNLLEQISSTNADKVRAETEHDKVAAEIMAIDGEIDALNDDLTILVQTQSSTNDHMDSISSAPDLISDLTSTRDGLSPDPDEPPEQPAFVATLPRDRKPSG